MISYEEFSKVELRTAKILEAEHIEGSEKLIKLQVELGEEKRQILAGLARNHKPEDLVGKTIVIVANLAPRMMMGQESQGMLLAADSQDGPVLLTTDIQIPSGATIK